VGDDTIGTEDSLLVPADIDKLGEYYQSIMVEVCHLIDHAGRALARAKPPITVSSRRYVESACLSIRRTCEYLAILSVFAHHWDGREGPDLMAWSPKDLLGSVNQLSDHPTPAPIFEVNANKPLEMLALPVEIGSLVQLYGQCSALIHVGRPNRIIKGMLPSYDLHRMSISVCELAKLAKAHVLMLPGIQRIVVWHGAAKTAFVCEAPGEGGLVPKDLPSLNLSLYP
jgi:hypothetical protein